MVIPAANRRRSYILRQEILMNVLPQQMTTEHELKIAPTVTQQAKLFSSLRRDNVAGVLKTIQAMLGMAEFDFAVENVKSVIDDYYDTADLALFYVHSVCRIRRD